MIEQKDRLAISIGVARPDFIRDEVLAEVFAAAVTGWASELAIITDQLTFTFAELDRRSSAMAAALLEQGVGVGDIVAMWLPRGIEAIIAQLAITKTGAAWLPLDFGAPQARIHWIIEAAKARCVIVPQEESHWPSGVSIHTTFDLAHAGWALPRPPARVAGLTPSHPAYVIFTSGTTGEPKGIVVTHSNICHFLRSANHVYGIVQSDVVLQGASPAFDLAIEETWITLSVGARLVVADQAVMSDGDALEVYLRRHRVTVLDVVPTHLQFISPNIDSVRLVVVGGEACSSQLVEAWARPDRRFINSYGPTETTIAVSAALLRPGEPVSIGHPFPNMTAMVVDPQTRELCRYGEQGELWIGGPCVSLGYIGRPDLTADRFVPALHTGLTRPVHYRTGDAAVINECGDIHFRGRIDQQVKIRGFRIELGEIEALLQSVQDVKKATVIVLRRAGIDQLAAYIEPMPAAQIDITHLKTRLKEQLPSYMVPGEFRFIERLPVLASGKIDRKRLVEETQIAEVPITGIEDIEDESALSVTEAVLLSVSRAIFVGQRISIDADFFADLGGHSLLAASLVSKARGLMPSADISLKDVYEKRSVRAIAAAIDLKGSHAPQDRSFAPCETKRRLMFGLAQAFVLPCILFLKLAQWLGVFVAFVIAGGERLGAAQQAALLFTLYMIAMIGTCVIAIIGKWLIIGRTRPGEYPIRGTYHFRLWLVTRLIDLIPARLFAGTVIMNAYLRLLGARVGQDAVVSEFTAGAIDLVSLGAGAVVGARTSFANAEVIGNLLVIGPVVIEPDGRTGTWSVLNGNTTIGEGGELRDLSALAMHTHVKPFEIWDGAPAACVGQVAIGELPDRAEASEPRRRCLAAAYVILLIIISAIGLIPLLPAFWLYDQLENIAPDGGTVKKLLTMAALAWIAALVMITVSIMLTVAIRWMIAPRRFQPGRCSIHSWTYYRKWIVGVSADVILEAVESFYATVFLPIWYRLLGTRIGRGTEISSNFFGRYDSIELGEHNFIGDETQICEDDIQRGWQLIAPVVTGDRVFVGNNAVVPAGARIDDRGLVGVKSKPPQTGRIEVGETWYGSPSLPFYNRQTVHAADAATYNPSWQWTAMRGVFEAGVASFPTAVHIFFATATLALVEPHIDDQAWRRVAAIFVAATLIIPMLMLGASIAVKWFLIGTYRPIVKPMRSWWCLRAEAVTSLYLNLACKPLLEALQGTALLPWVLRLYGVKIGRGTYIDTIDFSEFDCICIGDYCAINSLAALQTHLYEDRVMKVGRIALGDGVSVGSVATVLYDTALGDFAQIGPLTVVMKGESLPSHTCWTGIPSRPSRGGSPS
jgi:non-ribosomal peptide synthetase-like protein